MITIQEHAPLAPLTTFQIGGPARYLVEVTTEDQIREAISWAHEHNVVFQILGGGSNVLIADDGFNGLIIRITGGTISFAGTELAIDAGCNLLETIRAAADNNLGGWEKLSGIPGTVGGAVRGNAGAFGSEIKDFVHKVHAVNMHTGISRHFTNAECGFQYRNSFFKQHAKWVITRAYLHLQPVNSADSEAAAAETIAERERRHLQNVQAAGSFFMNPVASVDTQHQFETEKNTRSREGRVPAGWLIEKAGMKGVRVGGAIASLQHPNYLVNEGTATSADVLGLAEEVKSAVFGMFGIELHEEASIIA